MNKNYIYFPLPTKKLSSCCSEDFKARQRSGWHPDTQRSSISHHLGSQSPLCLQGQDLIIPVPNTQELESFNSSSVLYQGLALVSVVRPLSAPRSVSILTGPSFFKYITRRGFQTVRTERMQITQELLQELTHTQKSDAWKLGAANYKCLRTGDPSKTPQSLEARKPRVYRRSQFPPQQREWMSHASAFLSCLGPQPIGWCHIG